MRIRSCAAAPTAALALGLFFTPPVSIAIDAIATADRDLVLAFQGMDRVIANLANNVPQLRGKVILSGCGHWTQQERAPEVNAAMIDFLRQL